MNPAPLVLVLIGFGVGVATTGVAVRYTTRALVPSPMRGVLRDNAPALVRPMIAPADPIAA